MTEAQWQACGDPLSMLELIKGRASQRKLRLFAVACCRQGWRRLTNPYLRLAVETAEDYADARVSLEELTKARALAWSVTQGRQTYAMAAARATVREAAWAAAREAQQEMIQLLWAQVQGNWTTAPAQKKAAQQRQAALLRCIVGNPYRPRTAHPEWLTWNDATVVRLAEAIYERRLFDSLPILADALEEAGCADIEILRHCRQAGEHARGCWVVDLLLGKD